jgi:hypothetical protein
MEEGEGRGEWGEGEGQSSKFERSTKTSKGR